MIQAWQNFIKQANGIFQDGLVLQFAPDTLAKQQEYPKSSPCINDLSHYGLLAIQGKDAKKFLQGQLTCHMDKIDKTQGSLAAYCNRKGRMEACLRIFLWHDTYYLRLPKVLLADIQQELQKFVLFSKVTIEDVSEQWGAFGVCGQGSASCLDKYFNTHPTSPNQIITANGCIIYCLIPNALYQVYVPLEVTQKQWLDLCQDAKPVGWPVWDCLEIQHYIPEIYPDTRGLLLPHPLRLPEQQGVSFDKGCYRGQEIIARMEYRGKLKKITQIMTCQSSEKLVPGMPCYNTENNPIGIIVRSAPIDENNYLLLCELPAPLESIVCANDAMLQSYHA